MIRVQRRELVGGGNHAFLFHEFHEAVLVCVVAMAGVVAMMEPHQIGDPKPTPGSTHPSSSPSPSSSLKPGRPGPNEADATVTDFTSTHTMRSLCRPI
jgi:hypothetical protein